MRRWRAGEDVNFFTQVMGLRMAKHAALMDGRIPVYHLYYSNANIEPGSVMTTFPYGRKLGRPGSGQVQATAFTVARFGQSFIRFRHPVGLGFEVMEDAHDAREGWTTPDIGTKEAVRGFHGAVLSVREIGETERFFIEALGFRMSRAAGTTDSVI